MAAVESKHWAESYINDPLTAPDPSMETGPGSHFRFPATSAPQNGPSKLPRTPPSSNTSQLASNNPFRDSMSSKHSRNASSGSHRGPPSLSSHRAVFNDSPQRSLSTKSADSPRTPGSTRPRRSSSLRARFPGDNSIHPLDQITKEHRAANRSPHLKKKHTHGRDSIDKLDDAATFGYHHEGPYDAASLARNNSFGSSPLVALAQTNNETIRATPAERVLDSVRKHRPLDGVAQYPSGTTDALGHTYEYEEGTDMMRDGYWNDGSPYKRWPGVEYDDDDLKGKGKGWNEDPKGHDFWEHERRRKERKAAQRSGHGEAVELVERSPSKRERGKSGDFAEAELNDDFNGGAASSTARQTNGNGHSRGHGHSLSGELKKRMGSLKLKGRNKDD